VKPVDPARGLYRQRIEALLPVVERENAILGALSVVTAEHAREEAGRLDSLPFEKRSRLPLAGLPMVVKDLIDTPPACCRGGLAAFDDWFPAQPAEAVRLLREAGAIVIGVGATDEAGFGVRTLQVANPRAPGCTVGGSSGGSAAAVAAGWVGAALGTDTGGSIRIPAACCGVVGFKPTWGRVSTAGIRALAPSLDHVGPIAASVAEARAIARVIDPGFARLAGAVVARSAAGAGGAGPAGASYAWGQLRVGVVEKALASSSLAVDRAVQLAVDRLRQLGAQVSMVDLPGDPLIEQLHEIIFCVEAATAWSAVLDDDRRFGQLPARVRDALIAGLEVSAVQYRRALDTRSRLHDEVDRRFESVDLLLLPTLPVLAPLAEARQLRFRGRVQGFTRTLIEFTRLANHTGHPALALPLPPRLAAADPRRASLQLIAATDRDPWLLDTGEALEQVLMRDAQNVLSRG